MSKPLRIIVEAHIIYPGTGKGEGHATSYDDQDASKHFLNHYSNYVQLHHISKHSKDADERFRAEHETHIALRKMAHWQKHRNYDHEHVARKMHDINRQWEEHFAQEANRNKPYLISGTEKARIDKERAEKQPTFKRERASRKNARGTNRKGTHPKRSGHYFRSDDD